MDSRASRATRGYDAQLSGSKPRLNPFESLQQRLQIQHRRSFRCVVTVRGVQEAAVGLGGFQLLQHPARRPTRPEDLVHRPRRRRLQIRRGDVVVRGSRNALDVGRGLHPNRVPGGLYRSLYW